MGTKNQMFWAQQMTHCIDFFVLLFLQYAKKEKLTGVKALVKLDAALDIFKAQVVHYVREQLEGGNK